MMMTPKSKTIAQERAIGRGNRHVRGIGQAFMQAAQGHTGEAQTMTNFFDEPLAPADTFYRDAAEHGTISHADADRYERNAARRDATTRPATDGMLRFMWSLATYRDMPEGVRTGALLMVEDHRAGTAVVAFDVARAFIERYKDAPQRPKPAPATSGTTVVRDGMYRNPDTGEVFKVQYNRASGDGSQLYAKRLMVRSGAIRNADGVIVTPASVHFDYAPGAMREIRPEWRLSLADAEEFGALYGVCMRCARTLTLESSIAAGMGSTCAARKNW